MIDVTELAGTVFSGLSALVIDATEELDPVTQDMLIGQSGQLEQFHWFIRAHLETPDGSLSTGNSRTEKTAAKRSRKR
jgi:starvation-inducible DNA-binding protein